MPHKVEEFLESDAFFALVLEFAREMLAIYRESPRIASIFAAQQRWLMAQLGFAPAATVFRIAQEAVTNSRRHAREARRIDVRVRVDEGGVQLEVRDDGRGVASGTPGYGITGMRERTALLGGTCAAGPSPSGGWAVTASLPRKGWGA